jgi:hypothetical protein
MAEVMIEKTWKDNGSTELVSLEEAVEKLEGFGYYIRGSVRGALLEGAMLQTYYAYYRRATEG